MASPDWVVEREKVQENINEMFCRLCLNIISYTNSEVIEEFARQILEVVLPNLVKDLDEGCKHFMCKTCYSKLFAAFNFKSTCMGTEDIISLNLTSTNMVLADLKEVYLKMNENVQLTDAWENQRICRLCIQVVTCGFVALTEVDSDIIDTYIPLMNISVTKDPVICGPCFDSLRTHGGFVKNCLEVQEKYKSGDIQPYINTKGIEIKLENYDVEQEYENIDNPSYIKSEEMKLEIDQYNSRKFFKMKAEFDQRLQELMLQKKDRSLLLSDERYLEIINETKEALQRKSKGLELSSKQYRRLKRYDVLTVDEKEKLVHKAHLGKQSSLIFYCAASEMYDAIHTAHLQMGHKKEKAMENELKKKYYNVTREAIHIYLNLCQSCALKKQAKSKGLVVKPINMSEINSRCQVDLIDMQTEPDGEYKFILNYQDHLTKYVVLRPLKTNTADEVADVILDIFCLFGAPNILHSDNGREFCKQIIEKLAASWSAIKLVHGPSLYSQNQGSVERVNQDVCDSLQAWMSDNNCRNWAKGLRIIQSVKNRGFHTGIKRTPHEAMFGTSQRNGLLDTCLDTSIVNEIDTEEQLEAYMKFMKQSLEKGGTVIERPNSEIVKTEVEIDTKLSIETESNRNDRGLVNKNDYMKNCVVCGSMYVPQNEYVEYSQPFDATFDAHLDLPLCKLCSTKKSAHAERRGCKRQLEKQTENMVVPLPGKFPPVNVGDNVLINIPEVEHGRLAPRNVLAVVMEKTDQGLYLLGTKNGKLKRLYSRNEFQLWPSVFLSLSDVAADSYVNVHQEATSSGSKQGLIRCSCQKGCQTKACACIKLNIKCNSKCHKSNFCKNK